MKPSEEGFDVVVIGSGYGGAIVAERMATGGLRVCVLERGRAYPPGSFPRGGGGLRRFLWRATGGLYDVSVLGDIFVVTAAGLGGGSLIDAGMLVRADPAALSKLAWPLTSGDLQSHFDAVEAEFQASRFPASAGVYASVDKARPLFAAANGREVERPPLAIAFATGDGSEPAPGRLVRERTRNLHGRPRYTCRLVGECVMGCNYGAKSSLDLTSLSRAVVAGAEIRSGCEVERVEQMRGGYRITYRGLDGTGATAIVQAARVVLAAGALGTPRLLLRNRRTLPRLSTSVGTQAGTAGLRLTSVRRTDIDAGHGPTVTAALDVGGDAIVTDAGYPEIVHWLLRAVGAAEDRGASFATALGLPDDTFEPSRQLPSPQELLPLAVLGGGRSGGRLTLTPSDELSVQWPETRIEGQASDPIERLGQAEDRVLEEFGRRLVLQPVGGCPMSERPGEGVVDPWGAVWGYPGLFIADGSLLPGPIGAAPALTIAALADRIAKGVLSHG